MQICVFMEDWAVRCQKEKASPYDDRFVRLYDAGKRSSRKDQKRPTVLFDLISEPITFSSWQNCSTADGHRKTRLSTIWDSTKEVVEELPTMRKYPFKSGVNIMYGCNNFCSYCIVPYVRGRERSREPKDIIREIEKLVADGVCEIMLLGQNVNSYGKTLDNPITFAELLREVNKIEGLKRIRFYDISSKGFIR